MSLSSGLDGDAANFGFGPGEALGSESVWPALSGLVSKGILAYYFVKVTIKCGGNFESTRDVSLGHRLQQWRIPFIHLNPAYPPYKSALASAPTPDGGANAVRRTC
jgi:hypothetical protein